MQIWGGGYVTTTEKLSEYVKEKDTGGYIILSRDHGSLWKGKGEAKLNMAKAYVKAIDSLAADIQNDFDVLHIDVTEKPGSVIELYNRANGYHRRVPKNSKSRQ